MRYLVESQRIDLAHEGIDVTLVSPGFIDTPLTRRNDFPMPQLWSAERAARHIVRHLHRRPLEINFPGLFTWVLRVLGRLRHAPVWRWAGVWHVMNRNETPCV